MAAVASSESSSIVGDFQQILCKIPLKYSDALYDWQSDLIIRKNKDRENVSSRSTRGVSLRAFSGNGWLYANGNETDSSGILKLAHRLKAGKTKTPSAKLSLPPPITVDKKVPVKKNANDVPVEDKLQKVREIFNLAKSLDQRIVDVRVAYSDSVLDRTLASSSGTAARQVIPRTRISLIVIVKENAVTDSDYIQVGGTVGYEVVDDLSEDAIRGIVKSAVEQLRAIPAPRGLQTVLLEPGVVGTVCHESFGHGLEADQALRGRSYLREMLGKKVASEQVTMYEDASYEGAFGSYCFDDDGVLAKRNTIVEKGILVNFIHDMESAAAMNASLTGNSRTQNATRRRFIRMTNTYAKPGDWSMDEMVRDTRNGVLMMHWQYGMEDPLGGGMEVVANKGYIIKNGEKTTPLKSITLTGRVLDVLGNVDAVSKDGFMIDAGVCGKGSEDFVPVGSGGTWWRTKAVVA